MKILLFCLSFAMLSAVMAEEAIDYGAGEMRNPARTLYVSSSGNDKNDGKTLTTAWRTIARGAKELRAGDTLLIAEGRYFQSEVPINHKDNSLGFAEQCGVPGAPIRIMGMPGHKVVLHGAEFIPLPEKPIKPAVYEFHLKKTPWYMMIFEAPSQIELQRVYTEELALSYPGTYYYLNESGRLLVHFAASKQEGIHVGRSRLGLRIHGSYVHVENLIFENYYEAIYIRMNKPYAENVAEHITIKNCAFYHNHKNGLSVDGASKSLFIGNRGLANGSYGTVMVMGMAQDNLFTGNWFGPSPQTMRQLKPYETNFALSQYGGGEQLKRNHVIGNVLDDENSFRWKPGVPEARFEDNILSGYFYAESKPLPAVIRNNFFGGRVVWSGIGSLWDADLTNSPIIFQNNVRDRKDFKPKNKIVFEAEKLREVLPQAEFPEVEFKNLRVACIESDAAAILWETPQNDGVGTVEFRLKDGGKRQWARSTQQGVSHAIGLTGLQANAEYEFQAIFNGRRTEKKRSDTGTFTTAAKMREPGVLEVAPGKMTLAEASMAAIPGDIVKLAPGFHLGQFVPIRSGLPERPITLTGEKGAVIDGGRFYAPLVILDGKAHINISNLTFANPEDTRRAGVIRMNRGSDITVSSCQADFPWTAGAFFFCGSGVNITLENNISRGGDYPICIAGKNIKVRNNTIVDATMLSTKFWAVEDLEISNNIFMRPCINNKRNPALMLSNIKGTVVCDGNVFWSPIAEHPVGGWVRDKNSLILKQSKTLAEWQQLTGWDKNSIHADPMFVDYEKGDFRLREGSPAAGKGAVIQ